MKNLILFLLIILLFLINNKTIEIFYSGDNICPKVVEIKDELKKMWNEIPSKYRNDNIENNWKNFLSQNITEEDCKMKGIPNCCPG